MNAPTFIIIVAIAILMVFALRRAYRVFSLKDDCCGGGPKAPKAKKMAAATVEDTDEANYPFSLDVKVKGMTCEKCVGRVQNALNAQPEDMGEGRPGVGHGSHFGEIPYRPRRCRTSGGRRGILRVSSRLAFPLG